MNFASTSKGNIAEKYNWKRTEMDVSVSTYEESKVNLSIRITEEVGDKGRQLNKIGTLNLNYDQTATLIAGLQVALQKMKEADEKRVQAA